MLNRKIEEKINSWIDNDNSALLIDGARQVGKTYVIRKCFNQRKIDFIEFNFLESPQLISLIDRCDTVEEMTTSLSLFTKKAFVKGKTYIFFDEIQEYKEIVTKLKFWVDDGSYRYIFSGSMLGVALKNIRSAPVGYLKTLTMYPLMYEEFLQVYNFTEELKASLYKSFTDKTPVKEEVHEKMIKIFNTYLIVGGMPAAVEKFKETGNLEDVFMEQSNIIDQYKRDFTKYEQEEKKIFLTKIYELIPSELDQKNKRFNFSDIQNGFRFDRREEEFIWLAEAGVALPIYNVTAPVAPLKLNEKSTLFKLFLNDVGLLTAFYGKTSKIKILNGDKDINSGAIYENVVAQELIARGYKVYYYNSKRFGEVDFVIEYQGQILPIEIKSGKDYQMHVALKNIMNIEEYGINESYVLSGYNVSVNDKIIYLPIYFIMFLNDEKTILPKVDLDILKF